ncbi:filamentous hemagglutinin N-terminal domain-containing protein [Xenorhabdus sp. XENO-1]|uniref:filamentous hemagglutinin N-terminal domain-containing protein n=1 Tax=Xenorhabdus bovienii TaxID=40576 RepID=UPI0020CA388A|nr:filamentous hemagglutinin N-terminal domain-containing protein [Xenorhabdus bovienii]MCP9267496.1 filamentous hemagglutinin N-terminal domain-containing protein [Xenorhabdus bovienii subsp. africana]
MSSVNPLKLRPITKSITYFLIYLTAIYPVHSAIAYDNINEVNIGDPFMDRLQEEHNQFIENLKKNGQYIDEATALLQKSIYDRNNYISENEKTGLNPMIMHDYDSSIEWFKTGLGISDISTIPIPNFIIDTNSKVLPPISIPDSKSNVSIINIEKPNDFGISYNAYQEFNISSEGKVLNNSTKDTTSQLAGQINKNPNFSDTSAKLIINEVTGDIQSQLSGLLEVAGDKASVMIANPSGITCDGCGFINVSQATLTTGQPKLDEKGALESLTVNKGQITVSEKGLNAQETNSIDLISRTIELNNQIRAKNLNITLGTNQINYKNGTITGNIKNGNRIPQLALDTKALGGMYANKIRLISTENGVGVNLYNIESIQDGITLGVNGKLELSNIKAKNDLNVTGKEIIIDIKEKRSIIDSNADISSGRDIQLYGDAIRIDNAILMADNNMWIQKNQQGDKSNLVENKRSTIKTKDGDLIIRTNLLNNVADVLLQSDQLVNQKDLQGGEKYITVNKLDSDRSVIESGNNLYINATTLNNVISSIESKNNLILTGQDLNVKSIQNGDKHLYSGDIQDWRDNVGTFDSYLKSGGNLVADFSSSINIQNDRFYDPIKTKEITIDANKYYTPLKSNKDIILQANLININNNISSEENILILAKDKIDLDKSKIHAKNDLTIISDKNIDIKQSNFIADRDLTLISNSGSIRTHIDKDVNYFFIDHVSSRGSIPHLNTFISSQDLTLSADKDISLYNVRFKNIDGMLKKTRNVAITANEGLNILHEYNFDYRPYKTFIRNNIDRFSTLLSNVTIEAQDSIYLNSGNKPLTLEGIRLKSDKDVTLISSQDINLNPISNLSYKYYIRDNKNTSDTSQIKILEDFNNESWKIQSESDIAPFQFWISIDRLKSLATNIYAHNNILVNSGGNLNMKASSLKASNTLSLISGNDTSIESFPYSINARPKYEENDFGNYHINPSIVGEKGLTLLANENLSSKGSSFISLSGNLDISVNKNILFESVKNDTNYQSVDGIETNIISYHIITLK